MLTRSQRSWRLTLADELLGKPVEEWIAERRPHTSYRLIARELWQATEGRVDITGEMVRLWLIAAFQDTPRRESPQRTGRRSAATPRQRRQRPA